MGDGMNDDQRRKMHADAEAEAARQREAFLRGSPSDKWGTETTSEASSPSPPEGKFRYVLQWRGGSNTWQDYANSTGLEPLRERRSKVRAAKFNWYQTFCWAPFASERIARWEAKWRIDKSVLSAHEWRFGRKYANDPDPENVFPEKAPFDARFVGEIGIVALPILLVLYLFFGTVVLALGAVAVSLWVFRKYRSQIRDWWASWHSDVQPALAWSIAMIVWGCLVALFVVPSWFTAQFNRAQVGDPSFLWTITKGLFWAVLSIASLVVGYIGMRWSNTYRYSGLSHLIEGHQWRHDKIELYFFNVADKVNPLIPEGWFSEIAVEAANRWRFVWTLSMTFIALAILSTISWIGIHAYQYYATGALAADYREAHDLVMYQSDWRYVAAELVARENLNPFRLTVACFALFVASVVWETAKDLWRKITERSDNEAA